MATANNSLQRVGSYDTVLQPWTQGGFSRIDRHLKFINASLFTKFVYGGSAGAVILTTAVAGGVLGARIGKTVAPAKSEKMGEGIGFTIGFSAGAGCGLYIYVNRCEKSRLYVEWISEIKDAVIDDEFRKQCREDIILKYNKCPITLDVMLMPARTPTGYLFDMTAIDSVQVDGKNRIPCPFTRELISTQSVVVDIERALLIHKRILDILSLDIQNAQGNPEVAKALKYKIDKIKTVVEKYYNNVFELIEQRRSSGKINFQESQKEREHFVDIFGKTPDYKLDWSFDWKDTLKKRWIYFHPEIPVFDSNETV